MKSQLALNNNHTVRGHVSKAFEIKGIDDIKGALEI